MRQLHIGGKEPQDGWEILDIQSRPGVDHIGDAADLSRFADATFQRIYASHVLEHFGYMERLQQVLAEWFRVLAPQGELMLSVPDLETLCRLFLQKDRLTFQDRVLVMRMMFGGQTDPYDYHYVGFDQDILLHFLQTAGFTQFRRVSRFGLFKDASNAAVAGQLISLNIIAAKPA